MAKHPRRAPWTLSPGDLPSESALECEPRLRGLEVNAFFRLLTMRRTRGTEHSGASAGWVLLLIFLMLFLTPIPGLLVTGLIRSVWRSAKRDRRQQTLGGGDPRPLVRAIPHRARAGGLCHWFVGFRRLGPRAKLCGLDPGHPGHSIRRGLSIHTDSCPFLHFARFLVRVFLRRLPIPLPLSQAAFRLSADLDGPPGLRASRLVRPLDRVLGTHAADWRPDICFNDGDNPGRRIVRRVCINSRIRI